MTAISPSCYGIGGLVTKDLVNRFKLMDGRKHNKGTVGNKGGRPSKTDEQVLIERLTPMSDEAHRQLQLAVTAGEQWAIKLWFEYFYGKPKQSLDIQGEQKQIIVINEITKK